MKYSQVAFLIVMMISCVYADASSDQYRDLWQWRMFASASNGSHDYGYHYGTVGVFPEATDGFDGEQLIASWDIPTTYAAVFHDEGVGGWNGDVGFYLDDYVGPLPPGQTKTWQIYVWSTSDMPADHDVTHLVMNRTDNIALTSDFFFDFKLISKPESVSGGPDIGTIWNLDSPISEVELLLPTYRTDDRLSGYQFEFSATPIPEPSSLLALGGGLMGLAGLLRKRMNSKR